MSSRSTATASVAVAVVLLVDVLGTWLLSVTTIYGQAGDTSTYTMIGFALAWFLVAGLAVPLGRVPALPPVAAVVVLVARLVLQAGISPEVQVYASSVTLLALLVWLIALAQHGIAPRALPEGVLAGLAASATLHVALGGIGPMWAPDALAWPLVALLGTALVASTLRRGAPPDEVASRRSWFLAGGALMLGALVFAAPLRATLTPLPSGRWPQLVVLAGCLGGWALCRLRPARWGGVTGAVALVAGTCLAVLPRVTADGVHGVLPTWAVAGQLLAALGAGLLLGRLPGVRRGRAGLAAWGGLLVMFLGTLLFFAVQEIALPYPSSAVPIVVAVLVAVVAVPARLPHEDVVAVRRSRWPVPVAALVALVAVLPAATRPLPPAPHASGTAQRVRLVSYNIHVGGVSLHGRYDADRIAAVIEAQHPDLVWLSEADRGWLVDGDHDALPALARRLGMRYAYAPAAGPDWGDAVLSRFPLQVLAQRRLPAAAAPTGAEALAVRVDLGGGHRLALVGTHLQTLDDNVTVPVAQASAVAAMASRLEHDGLPVVVTGDLNAAPGSHALAPLDRALTDGLARWRPVRTDPSDHPTQQLDQVYVGPNLDVSDLVVPATTASDHRPVAVTLTER